MAEDIRFMIQGRTLKGSQAHYALTSSRLEIIHESHLKAMYKFKMPLVMELLFNKAKELNVFSYPTIWGKSSQSIYKEIFSREPS